MAYKIRKSKEFLNNLLTIQTYIEQEWGIKSSEKFQKILDSKIDNLSIHPQNRKSNCQE
jgi:plasmid stabilization system protein ParE